MNSPSSPSAPSYFTRNKLQITVIYFIFLLVWQLEWFLSWTRCLTEAHHKALLKTGGPLRIYSQPIFFNNHRVINLTFVPSISNLFAVTSHAMLIRPIFGLISKYTCMLSSCQMINQIIERFFKAVNNSF